MTEARAPNILAHRESNTDGAGHALLMIGEDNPFGSTPEFALYPAPRGCSGHRLMQILGLPEDAYLSIWRTNLCACGAWSMKTARKTAQILTADPMHPWRTIVLFGRKVADAFEYDRPFFTHGAASRTAGELILVSLPHPSGRNAGSWSGQAPSRARQILRELAPEVPWGSIDAKEAAA